jgi:uncharacterized membrane protein
VTRHWQYVLRQLGQKLWLRSAIFVALGVLTVPAARLVQPLIPTGVALTLGSDAVGSILDVIATSMLAVTTFSLATMVQASAAVVDNTTPRAAKLLTDDNITLNALSTFVGAFMFSLVGIIVLNTGVFDVRGRMVLLIVTLAVIAVIVVTLLRWIDVLSRIARVDETLDRVEAAVSTALQARRRHAFLGGTPPVPLPAHAEPLASDRVGHVVYVDIEALSAVAEAYQAQIHLVAVPGIYLVPPQPILWFEPRGKASLEDVQEADLRRLRGAVVVGHRRTFEQDPRFGMVVLGQIASRALSPAVNDPGTAIDVVDAAVRLLAGWTGVGNEQASEPEHDTPCPRVHVPGLSPDDLLEDVFPPIARDGAENVAVAVRLQKALTSLVEVSPRFEASARVLAEEALERGLAALQLSSEREYLRRSAALAPDADSD